MWEYWFGGYYRIPSTRRGRPCGTWEALPLKPARIPRPARKGRRGGRQQPTRGPVKTGGRGREQRTRPTE